MAGGPVFAAQLQLWIAQVVCDPALRPQPTVLRLAMLIAVHLNHKSWECFPSQERLAALLGCSVETVRRAALVLVKAGHLALEPGGGRRKSSTYKPVIRPGNPLALDEGVSATNPLVSELETPSSEAGNPLALHEGGTLEEPKKEEPRENLSLREGFEELWLAYPKRVAKERAWKAYQAVIGSEKATHDALLWKAREFDAWAQRKIARDRSDRFIPHLSTWLADGGWNDHRLPDDAHGTKPASGPQSAERLGVFYRAGLAAAEGRKREGGES